MSAVMVLEFHWIVCEVKSAIKAPPETVSSDPSGPGQKCYINVLFSEVTDKGWYRCLSLRWGSEMSIVIQLGHYTNSLFLLVQTDTVLLSEHLLCCVFRVFWMLCKLLLAGFCRPH